MKYLSSSMFFNFDVRILVILCALVLPNHLWGKRITKALPAVINTTINLHGDTLYLQKGVTIRFQGGKIINGTVVFNENKLVEPSFEDVRFLGVVADSYFNIKDYGAKSDMKRDCSVIFNDIIKLKTSPKSNNNPKHIYVPKGIYYIDKPIELFAGWNSPVTLYGEGRMSIICQRTDNQVVVKFFEQNHIKNLMLTYKNKQTAFHTKSVAVACQRAIYSIFENLIISKAYSAFGYISVDKQKNEYNPTGYKEQCYVSCNFRNIRIYETSGYAFNLKKEFPQGDSGSVYDNIYINSNDMNGKSPNNVSQGAIRFDNTVASFTQLNIEGSNYKNPLIILEGMSRVSVSSLHLEGIKDVPPISEVKIQSVASFDIIDIQLCDFTKKFNNAFIIRNSGLVNVNVLTLRQDCKCLVSTSQLCLTNNRSKFKIGLLLDPIYLFQKL